MNRSFAGKLVSRQLCDNPIAGYCFGYSGALGIFTKILISLVPADREVIDAVYLFSIH